MFLWGFRSGKRIKETDSESIAMETLYDLLGIDASQTVPDFAGRPQYLLEDREPIRELL